MFKPKKIIDPATGKERFVSAEEQELMLEKGILFDVPDKDEAKKIHLKKNQQEQKK